MRRIQLLNSLLWVVNLALGGGILYFAYQYLLFPAGENLLGDVEMDSRTDATPRREQAKNFTPFRNLVNPVEAKTGGPVVSKTSIEQEAKLLGCYRIGDNLETEMTMLFVAKSNLNVNAYRGEPILYRGQPVAELQGWTLARLTRDGAIFTNGQQEVELRPDFVVAGAMTGGGPRGGAAVGGPFDLDNSKTRKTAGTDTHESWMVDREEIEWAMQNFEQLISQVQLSAYPSGGVKIDAPGDLGSRRGFIDGDVIKTVNGRPVRDRNDLINLGSSEEMRRSGALVVEVERAGRRYVLDFRPEPKRPQR